MLYLSYIHLFDKIIFLCFTLNYLLFFIFHTFYKLCSYLSSSSLKILDPFLRNPGPVIYLGAISTGLCNYLQVRHIYFILHILCIVIIYAYVLNSINIHLKNKIHVMSTVTVPYYLLHQTIGQRQVPAEKAAIIYSMDPVYGGTSIGNIY